MANLACQFPDCDASISLTDHSEAIAIALYTAHTATHTMAAMAIGPAPATAPRSKAPPLDRPKLEPGTSLADWNFFSSRWTSFKTASDVPPDKVVHQLLGSLDTDLQRLLYRENNKPENLSEKDLLELLKKIAVKPENIWCAREKMHTMTQDTGEPVSNWSARLKGQGRLCGYTLECSGCAVINDFTDTVIMGELVRGLADPDIKQLVLSEVVQKEDLPSLISLIEAKEYGKRSSMPSESVGGIGNKPPNKTPNECRNCGTNHGGG